MSIEVSCEICLEELDERDKIEASIKCWKCGWSKELEYDYYDDDEWIDSLINVWLPYD